MGVRPIAGLRLQVMARLCPENRGLYNGAMRGGIPALEPGAAAEYAALPGSRGSLGPRMCRESGPLAPPEPRLLDRVRQALRARHMSRRTVASTRNQALSALLLLYRDVLESDLP